MLIERLKTEGVVDVFQTVRKLRLQRPGMVATVVSIEYHSYSLCVCVCVCWNYIYSYPYLSIGPVQILLQEFDRVSRFFRNVR